MIQGPIFYGGEGIEPFLDFIESCTRGNFVVVTDNFTVHDVVKDAAWRRWDDQGLTLERHRHVLKVEGKNVMFTRGELQKGVFIRGALIHGDYSWRLSEVHKIELALRGCLEPGVTR